MKIDHEKQIDGVFARSREVSASDGLRDRVSRLSNEIPHTKTSPRIALALAGAGAFAMFATVMMMPKKASAAGIFERMTQAMGAAKSIHMRGFWLRGDKWTQTDETWYADGNWRVNRSSSVEIYGVGKKWIYDPDEKTAIESDRDSGESPEGATVGAIQLSASYAALNRRGFQFQLSYGKPFIENSHALVQVVVTRPGHDTERDIFVVDQKTDLPLRGENQIKKGTEWTDRMRWLCEYDVPISPRLFTANFPVGAKVLSQEAVMADWAMKLENPIRTAQIDSNDVVVRSAFMNTKGWVFLLWTGNIGGHDYRLSLRDDRGNSYVRAYCNPGVTPSEYSHKKRLAIDGKVVDGAWFVPLNPMEVTSVKSVTLKVTSFTIPEMNQSGARISGETGLRPYEPTTSLFLSGTIVNPIMHDSGSIAIPVERIESATLPSYMPLFDQVPMKDFSAEVWAIEARKHYWMLRLSSDRREAEPTRALVPPQTLDGEPMGPNVQFLMPGRALLPGSDREVLKRLEVIERELIDAEGRWMGDSGSGFEWFDLSVVQRALGETAAADKSVEMAERIRPEIHWR